MESLEVKLVRTVKSCDMEDRRRNINLIALEAEMYKEKWNERIKKANWKYFESYLDSYRVHQGLDKKPE